MYYCLSANHNPELQYVICTGAAHFALVLHCTALNQSEWSNFFMYWLVWPYKQGEIVSHYASYYVAVGSINWVATLTGFSYKKMPGQKDWP